MPEITLEQAFVAYRASHTPGDKMSFREFLLFSSIVVDEQYWYFEYRTEHTKRLLFGYLS